jgi:hypothetical protein
VVQELWDSVDVAQQSRQTDACGGQKVIGGQAALRMPEANRLAPYHFVRCPNRRVDVCIATFDRYFGVERVTSVYDRGVLALPNMQERLRGLLVVL